MKSYLSQLFLLKKEYYQRRRGKTCGFENRGLHSHSILRDTPADYFNQKQFADFLSEHGLNYDKRKLNVYYSRGKIPKADFELAGIPYWCKSKVEEFCEQEKERLKQD
ncbi:hypothetical protein NDK43_21795 [Neobacillus pocheonensis]|uniref:Uncharacterized protein n=1 Tax=Neobacillus pocheonensis TaxID=363869 RepID=A0ABT0WDU8_9BACI|nr:hypothetical protein [Neobacillus pocheonensis]